MTQSHSSDVGDMRETSRLICYVEEKSHYSISSDKDQNSENCRYFETENRQPREKLSVLFRKIVTEGERM